MTTRKPKAIEPQVVNNTGAHLANVSIVNGSQANEHTRAAVEALAKAAMANANAIAEIAKALKGGQATMEHGIYLSGVGK